MKLQFRLLALCLLSVALLGTDASSGNAQAAANSRAVTPLAVTAGGDTCAAATVIATLPYDDTSDTTGKTDQGLFLNMTCAGAGAVSREGPDLVYTFTVGTGSSLTFTLMPSASYDATIYIVGNCTSGSSCVVESDTGIEGQTETIGPRTFNPGTYYLYVDSVYPADDILGSGTYTLHVAGTFGTPVVPGFFTVTPCRILDTRDPAGQLGGPALAAGATRVFPIWNQCGVPSTAKSVSVNITVTQPTSQGHLILFPGGTPPPVSAINFRAGQTRANNAIVPLSGTGTISVADGQGSGTTHFILDVNGYFQ